MKVHSLRFYEKEPLEFGSRKGYWRLIYTFFTHPPVLQTPPETCFFEEEEEGFIWWHHLLPFSSNTTSSSFFHFPAFKNPLRFPLRLLVRGLISTRSYRSIMVAQLDFIKELQMYQTAVNANQVRMMCITFLYKHCIL
ncbi:unnamed protein product [Lactuca saligna]|uniref:Uncharacterized protein n=1 Tax=Lactuca saligna TaxID=75948 RepID=A0AA35ZA30_LACSI|nr:unnamed protein product [Lactuca saligna]